MFFQFINLSHLRPSTERILLSKIHFEQKTFFSKVSDEKMQLLSFLVWASRDDTELVVSASPVDFTCMFVFYAGSAAGSNLTEDMGTLTFLILQTSIKLTSSVVKFHRSRF